jgi:hypothetical protein
LINIRVADAGLAVTEVPSFEHSRIHGVSNLNAVRDGLRVLRTILHEYARSRRKRTSGAQAVVPDQMPSPQPEAIASDDSGRRPAKQYSSP